MSIQLIQEKLNIIETPPTSPEASVQFRDALLFLDQIWRTEGRTLPPDLVHYLQRRSYDKARLFIQNLSHEQEK